MIWDGFLLGLATGVTCLAYCSPVLVPFLLGEGRDTTRTAIALLQFMAGRLLGYLAFAAAAWALGQYWQQSGAGREAAMGFIYVLLAFALILFGWQRERKTPCAGKIIDEKRRANGGALLWPLLFGLFSGLNLCPPFLLAFAAATEVPSLTHSLLYFFSFFLGTSVYFLPLPLLGVCRKLAVLKTIGRLAALLVALVYLYRGVLMIAGGVVS